MARRAERLLGGLEETRIADRVAKVRFPTPAPCGRTPLTAVGLSKSYGSLEVFCDVDVAVDRGSRVAILGLNGAGKTTLLRILGGLLEPDTGEVRPGHGLRVGYYAQEHETLDVTRSVLDHMRSAAPEQSDGDLRRILGAFLFSGDDVNKPAGVLSGGEKTRLALATLVCSGANVLLLDEPTNDLDVDTLRALEEALLEFAGCAVVITHDRWFLDRVATHILAFEGDSQVTWFEGDWAEYADWVRETRGPEALEPHRIKYKPLVRA
jgi:ATPase subunit of ABC transporter with duplicated ATPase domains